MENIIIVVLVILLVRCLIKIDDLSHTPHLHGTYSDNSELPVYYGFENNGKSYILLKNDEIIDRGIIEDVDTSHLFVGEKRKIILSI